jgi:glycosidase
MGKRWLGIGIGLGLWLMVWLGNSVIAWAEPGSQDLGPLAIPTASQPTPTLEPESEWVPQWAKTVVWYQIFPERFRNGDSSNDPTLEEIQGAYPSDDRSPWQIHPWTSDWYELQPYEQANGRGRDFNIPRRRYGGDLQGVLDQLDYLQDLGVTALYLNPVFQSPSSHKYDGTLYHHIDPTFGPDPVGDRQRIAQESPNDPSTWAWTAADRLALELIEAVHQRHMRIIFDGVFNHIGHTSWAFRDLEQNQQVSPYRDWFDVISWDDPDQNTVFSYYSWYGVSDLPEFREDDQGIVTGPKQYIFNITKRWLDPDGNPATRDGIDGWRLDVPFCVDHPFWKDWRHWVKSINPEAYIVGEVFGGPPALAPYMEGDEFDAVMNYDVAFAFAEHYLETPSSTSLAQFDRQLQYLRDAFDPGVAAVMQNLFSSHDTNRLGSHIVNRFNQDLGSFRDWDRYHERSRATNLTYDTRKPTPAELEHQKLWALFQMTYVGAPMVYYGDEVGMWGANDPDDRKPMIWADLTYAPEVYRFDGSQRVPGDEVSVNSDLFSHYQRLIAIRNHYPALQRGNFQTLVLDQSHDIYGFLRQDGEQQAIVILNGSSQPQTLTLNLTELGLADQSWHQPWQEVWAESMALEDQTEDHTLELTIAPLGGRILVNGG